MKPIVSFTLFGTDMKYYIGAVKNTTEINSLLPDWEIRIYYHSDFILTEYIKILLELGASLINVKDLTMGGIKSIHFPYFWRFFSFLEDTPSIVRDLDSRFSHREVSYINSWLKTDNDYFIIRDHPWQSVVPSGLFGIKRKINLFEEHFNKFIKNDELSWGSDQTILQFYMENIDKDDVFYCGYDSEENYIPRDDKTFFIGMQLDEKDKPTVPSGLQCLNYLNEINL